MHRKIQLARLFPLILCLSFVFLADATAQTRPAPRPFEERFILRDLAKIHGAQMTFQATAGNGAYGSLQNLLDAGFIDAALAGGEKYGYVWTVTTTAPTGTTPARFVARATPRQYPKSGRRSFYIDEIGEIRAANRAGQDAGPKDPVIDSCALLGIADNERCTIGAMRALHGAQMTYQATVGNGNFGSFDDLYQQRLINSIMRSGWIHRYTFMMQTTAQTPSSPATFKVTAVPEIYGVFGYRSFFIDTTGVLRGADKNGNAADETDPPVSN